MVFRAIPRRGDGMKCERKMMCELLEEMKLKWPDKRGSKKYDKVDSERKWGKSIGSFIDRGRQR